MKKRNAGFILNQFIRKRLAFGLVALACAFLAACENPIIETWWRETKDEPEPSYHAVLKHLPPEIRYIFIEVIQTVVSTLPSEKILQNLEIIEIEYIIFAGGQTEYNVKTPGEGASTSLTQAQFDTNNAYLASMTNTLHLNPEFLVVVHGHANPTLQPGQPGFEEDLAECERIAIARARSVAGELARRGITWIEDENNPNFSANRIKTNGFAGNRTIADPTHPELNRRVEVIIVNITTTITR